MINVNYVTKNELFFMKRHARKKSFLNIMPNSPSCDISSFRKQHSSTFESVWFYCSSCWLDYL